MRHFDDIFGMAVGHRGSAEAVEALLPTPVPHEELTAIPDHRWLSTLSRMVFSAGFNWQVVADKWPAFEEAFHGFEPGPCSMMDDEACLAAAKAGGIGHLKKALSVRENACLLRDLSAENGTAAKAFARWPSAEFAGLLDMLKRRGDRLGGTTAQYALRQMGRDGWVMTADVAAALVRESVVDKPPSSKRDMAAVQSAFDTLSAQSNRPFMAVSRVLALSVG